MLCSGISYESYLRLFNANSREASNYYSQKQKRNNKWINYWAKIFRFARTIRSYFSESVTVDFPSRCNCGIIASEDISTLRLPFNPDSIYFPIFDTYRFNSFYRRISLCAQVCAFCLSSSIFSPPLNTFRIFPKGSILFLILRRDREMYRETFFVFSNSNKKRTRRRENIRENLKIFVLFLAWQFSVA